MVNKYPIKCSNCGEVHYYKSKTKKTKSCMSCRESFHGHPMKGKKHSEETKKKLSDASSGISWEDRLGEVGAELLREKRKLRRGKPPYQITEEIKKKMSDAKKGEKSVWYGKKHTDETREKISWANSGKKAYWYNKTFSNEHKEKLRNARLNQVRTKFGGVFYNPTACKYFEELEKQNNWNGYYATKNDEVVIAGYSVDYYEPTQNIIIEYDEPHHYTSNGKLKKKDVERQKIIMSNTTAKFYRYNESTGELHEYSLNNL